jgi:hypothetical protein
MAAPKPSDLVVGDEYLAVVCPHCENVIPLGPPMKLLCDPGTQPTSIGCPFCGKSAEHVLTAKGQGPLVKRGPGS